MLVFVVGGGMSERMSQSTIDRRQLVVIRCVREIWVCGRGGIGGGFCWWYLLVVVSYVRD